MIQHFKILYYFRIEVIEIKMESEDDIDAESSIQNDNKMYVRNHDNLVGVQLKLSAYYSTLFYIQVRNNEQ